jgi:TonB family protein
VRRALLAAFGALALAAPLRGEPPGVRVAGVELVDALAQGPSAAERLAEIRRRIQQAVVYPPSARRRGLEGTSRVEFEIDPAGLATGVELVGSSGHPILDRAARRCVRAAGVLPRVYGRLRVPVRFELEAE